MRRLSRWDLRLNDRLNYLILHGCVLDWILLCHYGRHSIDDLHCLRCWTIPVSARLDKLHKLRCRIVKCEYRQRCLDGVRELCDGSVSE